MQNLFSAAESCPHITLYLSWTLHSSKTNFIFLFIHLSWMAHALHSHSSAAVSFPLRPGFLRAPNFFIPKIWYNPSTSYQPPPPMLLALFNLFLFSVFPLPTCAPPPVSPPQRLLPGPAHVSSVSTTLSLQCISKALLFGYEQPQSHSRSPRTPTYPVPTTLALDYFLLPQFFPSCLFLASTWASFKCHFTQETLSFLFPIPRLSLLRGRDIG